MKTLFALLLFPLCLHAVAPPAEQYLEVPWKGTADFSIPAAQKVLILDPLLCQADVFPQYVRFSCQGRGETVAFLYLDSARITLRLHVLEQHRDDDANKPSLNLQERPTVGTVGTTVQTFHTSAGQTDTLLLHRASWNEAIGNNTLSIQAQGSEHFGGTPSNFALDSTTIQYSTPHSNLTLVDFIFNPNGALNHQIVPYAGYNSLLLRGVQFDHRIGNDEYTLFAGTTYSPRFFGDSSEIAGVSYSHAYSPKLNFFSTAAVDGLLTTFGTANHRIVGGFATTGLIASLTPAWSLQASVGLSNFGLLAQAAVLYSLPDRTFFATGTRSAVGFPLNGLQVLPAGRSSFTVGGTKRLLSWLNAGFFAQKSSASTFNVTNAGTSEIGDASLTLLLSQRQQLNLDGSYTRTVGNLQLAPKSTSYRGQVSYTAPLAHRLSNSAQLTLGGSTDPFQVNSQDNFTVRDFVSWQVSPSKLINFSASVEQSSTSLVARLNQSLSLLNADTRTLFLQNPLFFVQSNYLPDPVRVLLGNLHPSNAEFDVTGQFSLSRRLQFSPTIGYYRTVGGVDQRYHSNVFGYSLTYSLSSQMQLVSTLSNVFFYDAVQQNLRHDTLFVIGLNRSLTSAPHLSALIRPRTGSITGRVYADLNVNGTPELTEPGLPGMEVHLSNGMVTRTDAYGRFIFPHLKPNLYSVTLPLAQFHHPVRLTGPGTLQVELGSTRHAAANFGTVSFSGIRGNVYNDYLLAGERNPDAEGFGGILVKLKNRSGQLLQAKTDEAGDFEFEKVQPGDYELQLDASTLPANFSGPAQPLAFHTAEAQTIVKDLGLRALRSLSGSVSVKTTSLQQPVEGLRVSLNGVETTTDQAGRFFFRDVPAGQQSLTLLAVRQHPDTFHPPSWTIPVSRRPVELKNIDIVVSNPDSLRYLLPAEKAALTTK